MYHELQNDVETSLENQDYGLGEAISCAIANEKRLQQGNLGMLKKSDRIGVRFPGYFYHRFGHWYFKPSKKISYVEMQYGGGKGKGVCVGWHREYGPISFPEKWIVRAQIQKIREIDDNGVILLGDFGEWVDVATNT